MQPGTWNLLHNNLPINRPFLIPDFIGKFRYKLKEEAVENAYTFNLASYHHASGNYGKVLELLLQVDNIFNKAWLILKMERLAEDLNF